MTVARRIRRPFRSSHRKPSRGELRALIVRLYGPYSPFFLGSPYEGTRDNTVEMILHEWGHIVQAMPWALALEEGETASDLMFDHLRRMPKYLAERNEIRAVAITVGVARALGLPIVLGPLAWSAVRNSQLMCDGDPAVIKRRLRPHERQDLFERLALRASRTPAVRRCVQDVLDLIDRRWAASVPWW